MTMLARFCRDERAAGAAEFALVVPLLIVLLFGLIDVGRFMWECNRAEKATQMGARMAVSTDVVAPALETYSFAVSGDAGAGSPVPTSAFERATCDDSNCDTCEPSSGAFCTGIGYDGAAFTNIVDRMSMMYPAIEPENVEVEYRNVGLGFAGDPGGPDVSALVTVRLNGLQFNPLVLFGLSIDLPEFRAALTLEDAEGTWAN